MAMQWCSQQKVSDPKWLLGDPSPYPPRDCLALCLLNSGTSIFAGFAVFSVLGFMANELHISMEHIVQSGKP